ncbi:hypothetical protein GGS20DRAFT_494152 [Poronia punctata]|nr:hypothetical protein GGS20DRAFT_494152 [Poronia punctata]
MAVSALGTFFIIFFILLFLAAVSWVGFTQLRARRLGLPSPPLSSYIPFARSSYQSQYGGPQPKSGGIRGWIKDRLPSNKNSRSAAGAYEQPSAAGSRHGFGALDPDEAWDARVGHEGYGVGSYYPDDQELEDRGHHNNRQGNAGGAVPSPYTGSGYEMNLATDDGGRGRSTNPRTSRPSSMAAGPGNGNGNGNGKTRNPFDDAAEPSNISLRGVSPRPIDTRKTPANGDQPQESPTSMMERRSIFREDI